MKYALSVRSDPEPGKDVGPERELIETDAHGRTTLRTEAQELSNAENATVVIMEKNGDGDWVPADLRRLPEDS